jgi:hypothetical protein
MSTQQRKVEREVSACFFFVIRVTRACASNKDRDEGTTRDAYNIYFFKKMEK